MQNKFSPQRTCLCCRKKTDRSELYRIVFAGGLVVDNEKRVSGRGSYLCGACLSRDARTLSKQLSRAFRRQITTDEAEALAALASSAESKNEF